MMNNNPAPTRAGVILTKLIKIMFTAALMYGPAGAAKRDNEKCEL